MNAGEWNAWLQSWLKRHPLRRPPEGLEREFPQAVMARVRAEQAAWTLRWTLDPRWSFALGGALAAVLALVVVQRPPAPSVQEVESDVELLDLLEEEAQPGEAPPVSDEELLEELQRMDEAEMAFT